MKASWGNLTGLAWLGPAAVLILMVWEPWKALGFSGGWGPIWDTPPAVTGGHSGLFCLTMLAKSQTRTPSTAALNKTDCASPFAP